MKSETDKLKEIYLKYKFAVWPASTSLASILILVLVIIPQLTSYLDVQNKLNTIQNRSDSLEVKAAELEKVDDQTIKGHLNIVMNVLPAEQDVPETIALLQDVVNRSGLILKTTNYTSTRGGQGTTSFAIVVAGPLSSLRQFLVNLQNAPRIFQVEAINSQFLSNGAIVEAEIPVTVFYAAVTQNAVSKDQAVPVLTDAEIQSLTKLSSKVVRVAGGSGEVDTSRVPLGKANPFE